MAKTILLRNARLVLPERTVEPADLLIRDGRIAGISQDQNSHPSVYDSTFDLTGLTLFPGFIDVHIHGAVGVDTLDATPADLLRVSKFLAGHGVTVWLPTLVPAPTEDYERSIRAINDARNQQLESGSNQGARILGVHYEGPFVNALQCGALRQQFFRTFSEESDLKDFPRVTGAGAVHMMTIAPEVGGGVQLVQELSGAAGLFQSDIRAPRLEFSIRHSKRARGT